MSILLEQVVYGSFRFWDRGYDVLARSPGCRTEWLADVLTACRQFGEAPTGLTPASSLFAMPLKSGPWAIVGVEPQGDDDRGRPGALAFHALIVSRGDYRRLGFNPFVLEPAIQREWSASTTTLPALTWTVEPHKTDPTASDPRVFRIVRLIARGKRVAIESDQPIGPLAREVWRSLPESKRRRASVATWAFGNANRFDLVALPRLASVILDSSYADSLSIDQEASAMTTDPSPPGPLPSPSRSYWSRLSKKGRILMTAGILAAVLVFGGLSAALTWWPEEPPKGVGSSSNMNPTVGERFIGFEQGKKAISDLRSLVKQFDSFEVDALRPLPEIMAQFSNQVRYRGPILDPAELVRLGEEKDPDRDMALAWHKKILMFVDDSPLPPEFDRKTLRRQLEAFAASYHIDGVAQPENVPRTLSRVLPREGAIRPTPLAARYPALTEYARFLGRLPRLDGEGGNP